MTKTEKAKALIPYLRQSKKHDGPQSLSGQRATIAAWAEANGVDRLPEVVERGVSGSKSWRERDLGAAFAKVESGQAGGIIVAYQSRLTRESMAARAEFYEAMLASKGRLVCAQEGIDTATGDPKSVEMMFNLWASMARYEWQSRREGFADARREAVANGIHICSHVPVGYDAASVTGKDGEVLRNKNGNPVLGGLVPNGDAPAIRLLFELKAADGSWTEAMRLLEEAGVPNRSGGRWTHGSAAAIVRNPVYKGEARHGEFVNPTAHEAIVDPATWRRAQPGTRGPRQSEGAMLAGGLLRCSSCGRAMTPSTTDGRYRCRYQQISGPAKIGADGKPHNHCEAPASAKASDLEALVTTRLWAEAATEGAQTLHGPDWKVKGQALDVEPLETAVATAKNRYQALLATDLLAIDPAAFSAKAVELKAAVEAAEDALAEAKAKADHAGVKDWDGMSVPERRRWLMKAGVTVLVARGREPIAERATFVHRDPKVFAAEWRAAWREDAGLDAS